MSTVQRVFHVCNVRSGVHEPTPTPPIVGMTSTLPVDQLGEELRRRRLELGVSLRVVEQQTEISAATLSRIERGRTPDLASIERLANWLGVSVHASGGTPPGDANVVRSDDDLRRTIEIHLRANKHMSSELASAIAKTFDTVVRVEMERAAQEEAKRGSLPARVTSAAKPPSADRG